MSKPAMYRRWPTKQDLVIAAAESRIGPLAIPDLGVSAPNCGPC
ncbi:hypothetical protein ACQPXT_05320 [Streptomyces sp. CA-100214]